MKTLGPHVKTYEDINAESHLHWCILRSYFPFSYLRTGWLNIILQLTSIPIECLSSWILSCNIPVYCKTLCDLSYISSVWPALCSISFSVTSVNSEGLNSSWLVSVASSELPISLFLCHLWISLCGQHFLLRSVKKIPKKIGPGTHLGYFLRHSTLVVLWENQWFSLHTYSGFGGSSHGIV